LQERAVAVLSKDHSSRETSPANLREALAQAELIRGSNGSSNGNQTSYES
jgi:hypothetical protein